MEEITKCEWGTRTIKFPGSVKRIDEQAFNDIRSLVSVITSEKLEKLEGQQTEVSDNSGGWDPNYFDLYDNYRYHRCTHYEFRSLFSGTYVKRVQVVPGIKCLGRGALCGLSTLRRMCLSEGLETIGEQCFCNCSITYLMVPASVQRIGKNAFGNCYRLRIIEFARNSQLQEVIECIFEEDQDTVIYVNPGMKFDIEAHVNVKVVRLPHLDTKVGDRTVREFRQLREVRLPDGLKFVGENWFADCDIEKIVVPTSVLEIQQNAFKCCYKLKSVEFGEGSVLEKINAGAFYGSGLESFTCPPSLRSIADEAFSECGQLKQVALNEGLVVLGTNEYRNNGKQCNGAFESSAVEEIRLSCTLKKIGRRTFKNCYDLKYVVSLEDPEQIEDNGLAHPGVESFVAPASLKEIGEAAFYGCLGLRSVRLNEGLEVLGADEYRAEYEIGTEDEYCYGVFGKSGVEDVKLPSTLKRIGCDTFHGYKNLRHVILPEGLEKIGQSCFSSSGLEDIVIPSTAVEISKNAFAWTDNLKKVSFAKNSRLTKIGEGAFECSGLESFVAPLSLREIGSGAFDDCRYLKYVELNEGLEILGTDEHSEDRRWHIGVFQNSGVEQVKLPSTLKKIGRDTFYGCEYLKQLDLPEGLETIGNGAFCGSEIENFVAPASLRQIEEYAFYNCKQLKNVKLNEGLEKIEDECFYECGLELIEISRSVRVIGHGAFCGCKQLKNVQIPKDSALETVGLLCFSGTHLTQVALPEQITMTNEELGIGCPYTKYHIFPNVEWIQKNNIVEQNAEIFVVPACVMGLWDGTFQNYQRLRRIIFQSGSRLERICKDCFNGSGLEQIMLPDSVTEIQDGAFGSCKDLKSVTFGENSRLTFIGRDAFAQSAIETFATPAALRKICGTAFRDCVRLKHVELNEGLQEIGLFCFLGTPLKQVVLPKQITVTDEELGIGCPYTEYYMFPKMKCIRERNVSGHYADIFVVPVCVKELGDRAFTNCCCLRRIIFQSGSKLEKIGKNCFGNICQHCQLEQIAVPDGVIEIPEQTFSHFRCLKSVTFGVNSRLEKIGRYAFYQNDLKSFTAPPSLRIIENKAFSDCKQLQHIELNEGLLEIGDECFSGCGITQLGIPASVRRIGEKAFCYCHQLEIEFAENSQLQEVAKDTFSGWTKAVICVNPGMKFNIEAHLDTKSIRFVKFDMKIGDTTLKELRNLREVRFPDGLQIIGDLWFKGSGIEKVLVPASVGEIHTYAFRDCSKLRVVEFEEDSRLEKIGQGVFLKSQIESFVAPLSLREIGDSAFSDCEQLRSVELNKGLEDIGSNCFNNSSIEQLTIPASVKRIGDQMFWNCPQLTRIIFAENSRLRSVGRMFLSYGTTVYVHSGMIFNIEAYLAKTVTVVRLQQPSEM